MNVLMILHFTVFIIYFSRIHMLSIIFCGHILPTCTDLSVIVIDKPIGLGGTVYTSASIIVSYFCTIYCQNQRFENYADSYSTNKINRLEAAFLYSCPDCKLPDQFELHWLGNLGNLSDKEIQPELI